MNDVTTWLNKALALFQALVATGVVKSSSGVVIATIVADLEAVISGAQNPTPELAKNVSALLTDLKVNGVIGGQVIETLSEGLTKFEAFLADIKAGQVGIIDSHKSLAGVEGVYCFIPYGGPAATAIGLA